MSIIGLTSPIRHNLLNLQEIAKDVAATQNILATGMKVSSPLSNPSAYYTAANLNNRAADLNSLLDSISLSVETLKNVSNSIDKSIDFLKQAKALANQALFGKPTIDPDEPPTPPTPPPPPGSVELTESSLADIMTDNGIKGTVVKSQAQLLDALRNAREGDTIVIWGEIVMDNKVMSLSKGITIAGAQTILKDEGLQNNFHVESENTGKLVFNVNAAGLSDGGSAVIYTQENTRISDITINYNSTKKTNVIQNEGFKGVVLESMNVNVNNTDKSGANINIINNNVNLGEITMRGDNRFSLTGENISWDVVRGAWSAKFTLEDSANLYVKNLGTINGGANYIKGTINSYNSTNMASNASVFEISGTINVYNSTRPTLFLNLHLTIKANAILNIVDTTGTVLKLLDNNKSLTFEKDANISYTTDDKTKIWLSETAGKETTPSIDFIDGNTLDKPPYNWSLAVIDALDLDSGEDDTEQANYNKVSKLYNEILKQYEALINDSYYNGINLLKGENLRIIFNENHDSFLDIQGVDLSIKKLGINTKTWLDKDEIANSITELDQSINELRDTSAMFSIYYSVTNTRETFIRNITNVLNEGADKLILADMNKASAEVLALETRNILAVNSLSLANQAAQAILKVF